MTNEVLLIFFIFKSLWITVIKLFIIKFQLHNVPTPVPSPVSTFLQYPIFFPLQLPVPTLQATSRTGTFPLQHCPSILFPHLSPTLHFHGKLPNEEQFSCSLFWLTLRLCYSLTKFLYISYMRGILIYLFLSQWTRFWTVLKYESFSLYLMALQNQMLKFWWVLHRTLWPQVSLFSSFL